MVLTIEGKLSSSEVPFLRSFPTHTCTDTLAHPFVGCRLTWPVWREWGLYTLLQRRVGGKGGRAAHGWPFVSWKGLGVWFPVLNCPQMHRKRCIFRFISMVDCGVLEYWRLHVNCWKFLKSTLKGRVEVNIPSLLIHPTVSGCFRTVVTFRVYSFVSLDFKRSERNSILYIFSS